MTTSVYCVAHIWTGGLSFQGNTSIYQSIDFSTEVQKRDKRISMATSDISLVYHLHLFTLFTLWLVWKPLCTSQHPLLHIWCAVQCNAAVEKHCNVGPWFPNDWHLLWPKCQVNYLANELGTVWATEDKGLIKCHRFFQDGQQGKDFLPSTSSIEYNYVVVFKFQLRSKV